MFESNVLMHRIVFGLVVLFFMPEVKAAGYSLGECEAIVELSRQSLPSQIDQVTQRVDVKCTEGLTKSYRLKFFDEISSDAGAQEWSAALSNKTEMLKLMYCEQQAILDLLKHVDLEFDYRVNGANAGSLVLTERQCIF